jgi:hypothetical protein
VTTFSALREEVQYEFVQVDSLQESPPMWGKIALAVGDATKLWALERVEVSLTPPVVEVHEWKNRQPTLEVSCLDMK